MVWKEFWYGKERLAVCTTHIQTRRKSYFPRNHKSPKGLQDYLAAVKSDIVDPKNRWKVTSNISEDEKDALHHLVKLQKERQIVIKPCDKGAGIILLNLKSI